MARRWDLKGPWNLISIYGIVCGICPYQRCFHIRTCVEYISEYKVVRQIYFCMQNYMGNMFLLYKHMYGIYWRTRNCIWNMFLYTHLHVEYISIYRIVFGLHVCVWNRIRKELYSACISACGIEYRISCCMRTCIRNVFPYTELYTEYISLYGRVHGIHFCMVYQI